MYFAANPTSTKVPSQILSAIASTQHDHESAPLHVIALVDCAFDEQFFKRSPRNRWPRHSLYANTSLDSLGEAAPHLTAFEGHGELSTWLDNLFTYCSGKPMLSIIMSALDAKSLRGHLLPFMVCKTEDTIEWPVRWGDTRVLPGLIEALTEPQRMHLLNPIYCWWSVSRTGDAIGWKGSGEARLLTADFDKLPMADASFAALVDLAEPDAMLDAIYNSQPDILSKLNPAESYQSVSRNLRVATNHRIDAATARQHFSVLSLVLRDDFTAHPAMAEALDRVRHGGDYFAEISKLPDSFWGMTSLKEKEFE